MENRFHPKLSIITIVFNDVDHIERTLLSVINQRYSNIEYIIIDGASTDGTVDVIKKHEKNIDLWISEKDTGIYNAMNKGLALARGDYVLFMNSGDEIYDSETVEKVFSSSPDADIYYGETEMYNDRWESLGRRRHKAPKQFDWRSFKYGMCISHQAIYIRRSLIMPYDEKYQLSADVDWVIKIAKQAKTIINVQAYVAKYLVGGLSKKRHRQSLKERFWILSKHYGFIPNLFHHAIMATKLSWYFIKHKKTND